MKTICVLPRNVRTGRFLLELLAGTGGFGRADEGGFGMRENSHHPIKTVMQKKITQSKLVYFEMSVYKKRTNRFAKYKY